MSLTTEAAAYETSDIDPAEYLDNVLRLIGHVRRLKTRDPLRTLEDKLLELRTKVTST